MNDDRALRLIELYLLGYIFVQIRTVSLYFYERKPIQGCWYKFMVSRSDTPIRYVPGIGAVRAGALEKLGITTVRELLYHFPRGYQNRANILKLSECPDGTVGAFRLTVATAPRTAKISGNRTVTKFTAFDESGTCTIVFFNQPYVKDIFEVGAEFRFWGKLSYVSKRPELTSPMFEPYVPGIQLPNFVPIYPLTAGISQKMMASFMRSAIRGNYLSPADDIIPEQIQKKYDLFPLCEAVKAVHFPETSEDTAAALRRFSFERIYIFLLGSGLSKEYIDNRISLPMNKVDYKPFFDCIEFELTGAQKQAISEIENDMCGVDKPPMSRILTGDVGSGKTICAAAAIYTAVKNNMQAALMAPTEILARQHYDELSSLFEKVGIKTALLTGSVRKSERDKINGKLINGTIDLVIGTHALISPDISFKNLGLVITDEQHRFGVMQRTALAEKSDIKIMNNSAFQEKREVSAHILVMSATPIPRTLAFALYGDLEISSLDELPPGRQKIDTFAVDSSYLPRVYNFIRKNIDEGYQAYIVCPSIENEADSDCEFEPEEFAPLSIFDIEKAEINKNTKLKSVTDTYELLSKEIFPDIKIGMLHGKMNSKEKESVMSDFSSGKTKILISTTVIEVGINVPNASLMIIENAERFGLAQLHQLRGRVGRGRIKSFCILISDSKSDGARKRMEIMKNTNNGYEIAQRDLEIRGPGDFFPHASGFARQHGSFDSDLLTGFSDADLLKSASDAARQTLLSDPKIELPQNLPAYREVLKLFNTEVNTIH